MAVLRVWQVASKCAPVSRTVASTHVLELPASNGPKIWVSLVSRAETSFAGSPSSPSLPVGDLACFLSSFESSLITWTGIGYYDGRVGGFEALVSEHLRRGVVRFWGIG